MSTDALTLIMRRLTASVVGADEDAAETTEGAKRCPSEGAGAAAAAAATGGGRVAERTGGDRAAAAVLCMWAGSGAPGSSIADLFTREADVGMEDVQYEDEPS